MTSRGEAADRAPVDSEAHPLRDLAALFLTLGAIGFGGPAAHIALMRREVVQRRRWLSDEQLVDLVGLTSVIPGPNSTELAMLIGQRRAGTRGLLVAGLSFILPAALIVTGLAWTYVTYGATPAGDAVLYGVKPVVLSIVAAALVGFARVALGTPLAAIVGAGAAVAWLVGIHELLLLAAGAIVVGVVRGALDGRQLLAGLPLAAAGGRAAQALSGVDLAVLAAVFLKAGALLFGSGYVLLAYLRGDLVERLGWLTDRQLLDAIAIGQVTPGPLFTAATFIGYLLAGVAGASLATAAIFLPAFVLSALVGRVAGRLRERPLAGALLDGLNAASIGLMAAVSLQLATTAVIDPLSAGLAAAAVIGLFVLRLPSVALILAGAGAGLLAAAAGIGP